MTDDLPTPAVRALKAGATDADGPLFSIDQMRAYRAGLKDQSLSLEEVMVLADDYADVVAQKLSYSKISLWRSKLRAAVAALAGIAK